MIALFVALLCGCTSSLGEGGVLAAPDDAETSSSEAASSSDGTVAAADGDAPVASLPSGADLSITVDRISDGDSLRARSAEGDLEIRLLGLNAPEGDECFGNEAAATLERLLSADDIRLSPWPAEFDDFGRTLGFLVADGVFVNHELIVTGHAVARDQSDHGFAEDFEIAEEYASAARVGLWAADACGEDTGIRLEIVEIQADAPGNDQENPNGEWVIFENVGDADADLSGWSLRDESTRHRYEFPDITVAPGQLVRVRTGCGSDEIGDDRIELFWCDPEPPVWNNGGDTAFLLDFNGSIADYMESSRTR
jgi:micrococcal nuclease